MTLLTITIYHPTNNLGSEKVIAQIKVSYTLNIAIQMFKHYEGIVSKGLSDTPEKSQNFNQPDKHQPIFPPFPATIKKYEQSFSLKNVGP